MALPLIFFAGAGAGGYGAVRLKNYLNGETGGLLPRVLADNGGKQSGASPTEAEAAQQQRTWPAWKILGAGAAGLAAFYIAAKYRPFRRR